MIKQCKERATFYKSNCHYNLCHKSLKVFREVSWEPLQTGRELRPDLIILILCHSIDAIDTDTTI